METADMKSQDNRVPPRITSSGSGRLPIGWVVGVGAALVIGCILFLFNPQEHGIYPLCLFNRITGLLCPGCGGLRATHELLHGHFGAAFRLNSLFVVALPIMAFVVGRGLWRRWRGLRPVSLPAAALWAFVAIIVLFGILRNLPAARQLTAFAF